MKWLREGHTKGRLWPLARIEYVLATITDFLDISARGGGRGGRSGYINGDFVIMELIYCHSALGDAFKTLLACLQRTFKQIVFKTLLHVFYRCSKCLSKAFLQIVDVFFHIFEMLPYGGFSFVWLIGILQGWAPHLSFWMPSRRPSGESWGIRGEI